MPVPNTAVGSTPSTADDSGERSCRRRHCHSCFFSPTAPPADSALNSAYWPFQSSIDLLRAMVRCFTYTHAVYLLFPQEVLQQAW
ncbi:hypothetical protein QSH57_004349 [Fusarium oxysporum f. sp. vasinfectum]|nr:hypothetical protein QSH57_004349 [Fusarium oxysporum f. sp. vasinfectum]